MSEAMKIIIGGTNGATHFPRPGGVRGPTVPGQQNVGGPNSAG